MLVCVKGVGNHYNLTIINCSICSCEIDWKKGKNVTVKTIKKKQKHKGRGTTRTVTKTVQNDSFFNFFNPPQGKGSTKYMHVIKKLYVNVNSELIYKGIILISV